MKALQSRVGRIETRVARLEKVATAEDAAPRKCFENCRCDETKCLWPATCSELADTMNPNHAQMILNEMHALSTDDKRQPSALFRWFETLVQRHVVDERTHRQLYGATIPPLALPTAVSALLLQYSDTSIHAPHLIHGYERCPQCAFQIPALQQSVQGLLRAFPEAWSPQTTRLFTQCPLCMSPLPTGGPNDHSKTD